MWARHMELMCGIWLAVSPFVFRYPPDRTALWIHDLVCAAIVAGLALAAHWRPLHRVHLLLLPVAGWLILGGWWQAREAGLDPLPALQNRIVLGLVLAMFAIVPSHASSPPESWRRQKGGQHAK